MELLLIPFLLVTGAALVYLGVCGVPRLAWSRADSPMAAARRVVIAEAPGPDTSNLEAIAGAVEAITAELASLSPPAPRRNVLKNVRPRPLVPGPSAEVMPATTPLLLPEATTKPETTGAPSKAEPVAATDAGPGLEDATARIGPSPAFGTSDALMGQLLMELSIVRDEIIDLRERVAALSVRHAVVSRAPGDPTRRRLRRISRYRG